MLTLFRPDDFTTSDSPTANAMLVDIFIGNFVFFDGLQVEVGHWTDGVTKILDGVEVLSHCYCSEQMAEDGTETNLKQ